GVFPAGHLPLIDLGLSPRCLGRGAALAMNAEAQPPLLVIFAAIAEAVRHLSAWQLAGNEAVNLRIDEQRTAGHRIYVRLVDQLFHGHSCFACTQLCTHRPMKSSEPL